MKLKELKEGDKIFSIGLAINSMEVNFVGECNIKHFGTTDTEYFKFSAEHPQKPYGISTSIAPEDAETHCVIFFRPSAVYFFTMKPESWQKDIHDATLRDFMRQENELRLSLKALRANIGKIEDNAKTINRQIKQHENNQ